MKRTRLGVFSVLAIVALAGVLASVPLAFGSGAKLERASATTVSVRASEFKFVLSTKLISRPGVVTFAVKNAGKLPHDFKINGKKTPLIAPGKSAKLVVSFKKNGSYPYLCTVPGHAAAGMKGVFSVK